MIVFEYIVQSAKWRAEFNIPDTSFPEDQFDMVEQAYFDSDYEKQELIDREAEDWWRANRPTYISPADYIVRHKNWRNEFSIPEYLPYAEQVRMANQELDNNRDRYTALLSEAEAWRQTESAKEDPSIPFNAGDEQIRQQIFQIRLNKYLMIRIPYGATNYVIQQGELQSVDWKNGTLLLRSTTYDNRVDTVYISKILSIDETRSGSGALGAVQSADLRRVGNDWYRGNTKL